MAPWSYLASVLYHDVYWYPRNGNDRVHQVLHSDWGRLFHNWERVTPDEAGFGELGAPPDDFVRASRDFMKMGVRLLGTALKEAPEVSARMRRWS
jgi:hypothetical protein